MHRVTLLFILLSFPLLAKEKREVLFNKLQSLGVKNVDATLETENRLFNYTEKKYKAKKFTAVIKPGATLQTLDGKNKYVEVDNPIVVNVEEVSSGSGFYFIFDKEMKPRFIALATDLKNISEVTRIHHPKLEFKREKFSFAQTDPAPLLKINTIASLGSHTYNFFPEAINISSQSGSLEMTPFDFLISPYLTTRFTAMSNEVFSWTHWDLGLKLPYEYKLDSGNIFLSWLSVSKSLVSQASYQESDLSIRSESYNIGAAYKWSRYQVGFEVQRERVRFSPNVNFQVEGLDQTQKYATNFLLGFGIEFGVNL